MKKNLLLLFLLLLFGGAVFAGLGGYLHSQQKLIELSKQNNRDKAVALFDNLIMTRGWNNKLDGVYMRQQDGVEANPHLKNGQITTDQGDKLVKVIPAWMSRERMRELGAGKPGYRYNITSLMPLSPENKPDAFEIEALQFFREHKNQPYYFRFAKNLKSLDFMGALQVTEECLQCHGQQGYRIGDNHGGIRITVPTDLLHAQIQQIERQTRITIISVTAIAVLIYAALYGLINALCKRQRAIQQLNESLNVKVAERTRSLEQTQKKLSDELQFQQMRAELYNLLIGSDYSVDKLKSRILSNAKQLTASPWALAGEVDPDNADLRCLFEIDSALIDNLVLAPDEDGSYAALWGHPLHTGEPFKVNRPVSEWLAGDRINERLKLQRVLSVPVMFNDALVGQLAVANKQSDYDEHDQQLLERLAKFYALSMHFLRTEADLKLTREKEKRYLREVKRLSITDPLTSLYNRRHFRELFNKRLNLAKRLKLFFGLLILDIDFFKPYNDRYGHLAGDQALVTTAKVISRQMRRSTEQAFRVGGEEFCCLVLAETSEDIVTLAESIRRAVKDEQIEHRDNPPQKVLTISVGLNIVSDYEDASYDKIYKAADDALYEAKSQGRDQVCVT
ncbi:diguanylate cyclase [Methylomarinum sp. Ch1-1]|uniref:diguanylate cyclase n=1 Tax=Methylomarinum roseum TaxID=3067653 RepID=A0AAU7NVV8_9GAMM|nr:diguanylate cyclase [Methylomarinum sp. Ch1-1]MDP4522883.1 diguanylate cyclase [Methylomarinum sp. Ch1-1]